MSQETADIATAKVLADTMLLKDARLEEVLNLKLVGLTNLVNEKFDENKRDHIAVWEQVKQTNGRLRLVEKFMWGFGGAIIVLATLFAPNALSAITKLL